MDSKQITLRLPEDVVLRMTQVYRTPWLRVQHLQRNPVFCDIFGLVPINEDEGIKTLRVTKEVSDVAKLLPEMVEKTLSKSELGSKLIKECREAAQSLVALIGSTKEFRAAEEREGV